MFSFLTNFFNAFAFSLIIPGIMAGIGLMIVSTFLPSVLAKYKIAAQVLGLILVVFFVFQTGRYVEVNKAVKVELKAQVKDAERETKSEKVNTETVIRYVDRVKVVEKIREVKTNVYVTQETDRACVIGVGPSADIAILLNDSVRGIVPRAPRQAASSAQ